ncbi:ATP-binding protein [Streptomyces sp. NPDC054933]
MTTSRPQPLRRQEVTLPAEPRAVPLARVSAQVVYSQWGLADGNRVVDVGLLILSELVTNSVRHAADRSPHINVTLALGCDTLVLAVHDRHPFHPLRTDSPLALGLGTGGRGLHMILELTAESGGTCAVRPDPDGSGKTVWITLPL